MTETFIKLGIPFPLFDALTTDANEYVGLNTCCICNEPSQHCFRLDIGCALMIHCPQCNTENGLDANDREDSPCRKCGATIRFPEVDEDILTCYTCLRKGNAAITKDTKYGMISWEQAFEDVTNGVPGINCPEFEMVPKEDDWVGARIPAETMFELLRTPTYSTIQGERWQFCHKTPMTFIGAWSRDEFTRRAPDGDGKRYFEEIVKDVIPGLWEDKLHDITGVYAFQCKTCGRITAHWDIA